MGILRADRVSGLGGANAIKGSVFYKGKSFIKVEPDSSFTLGTGDYTVEAWVYSERSYGGVFHLFDSDIMDGSNDSGPGFGAVVSDGQWNSYYGSGSIIDSGVTMKRSVWQHVALVRYSGTTKIYVNGTSIASQSDSTNYTSSMIYPVIGGWWNNDYNWQGYISNFRFVVGTAVYQSNFTPPTSELTAIDGTQILCFQTSDILREETGKTLFIDGESNNNAPIASRFTPNSPVGFSTTTDVGTQFGSTFDGVTTFDSQAYFVPPGGNTRERNRGRGLITGGATGSPSTNVTLIKYFDIASGGITDDFGNLTAARRGIGSVASSTRACAGGGFVAPTSPAHTVLNTIDFVTIANTANASDFGDMQQTAYAYATSSNQTRGLFAGGYRPNNSAVVNTIDLITIATTGNASNFGDLTRQARSFGGAASTTRGVFFGGTYPAIQDVIDFVTIATTGDATDFGNLTDARDIISGSSSNTRAVMGGGRDPSNTNIIDFITIASEGNATDFGDLTAANYFYGASSNNTRAVWASDASTNIMEFVTIATTGNSSDFGDQNGTPQHLAGVTSDSHGGLS